MAWATEDATDLDTDLAALPRLFRISLALRGVTYDEFLADRPSTEDGKRREEFIEWCFEKNSSLPPVEGGEGSVRTWSVPVSPTTSLDSPRIPPSPRRTRSSILVPTLFGTPSGRALPSPSSVPLVRKISNPFPASAPPSPPPSTTLLALPSPNGLGSGTKGEREERDEELMEGLARDMSMTTLSGSHASSSSFFAPVLTAEPREDVEGEAGAKMQADGETDVGQMDVVVGEGEEEATRDSLTSQAFSSPPASTLPPPPSTEDLDIVVHGEASNPVVEGVSTIVEQESAEPVVELAATESFSQEEVVLVEPTIEPSPIDHVVIAIPALPTISEPSPSRNDVRPSLPTNNRHSLALPPELTFRPATPMSQHDLPTPPTRSLRILSLDGGGIRGLPLLLTLRSALASLSPTSPLRPCESFDLITGISTGGLVALLLGRLRLTCDEAIEVYTVLAEQAFGGKDRSTRSRWSKIFASSSSSGRDVLLERALEALPHLLMLDPRARADGEMCKTAILAYQSTKAGSTARWFRSYEASDGEALSVRQVVRATLASSPFFKPYSPTTAPSYIDSPTSLNPSDATLEEVRTAFGAHAEIGSFVSIGVGRVREDVRLASKSKARSLRLVAQLSMNAAGASERFLGRARREGWGERVARFNVDVGGGADAGIEEWVREKALGVEVEKWARGSSGEGAVNALRKGMGVNLLTPGPRNGRGSSARSCDELWGTDFSVLAARRDSVAANGQDERRPLRTSISLNDFTAANLYLQTAPSTGSLNISSNPQLP